MTPNDLPTFEAQWWPVMLETVPGSGEAVCVAIVVRARNGQASVRQAIPPATLATLFGTSGKGMVFLVGQTVLDLKRQLDGLTAVELLELAFGGFSFGPAKDCVARDANEVFDIAMRLSTAFSLSTFGAAARSPDEEARRAFDEWAGKVRDEVLAEAMKDSLSNAFNVPITTSSKKKLRVGFVFGSYVAQFGVLRIGHSLSTDQRALKLKLFDLEVLQREHSIAFQTAELIVGIEKPGDSHPTRQREALAETWDFITHEAGFRGVRPVKYATAHDAGMHLRAITA